MPYKSNPEVRDAKKIQVHRGLRTDIVEIVKKDGTRKMKIIPKEIQSTPPLPRPPEDDDE